MNYVNVTTSLGIIAIPAPVGMRLTAIGAIQNVRDSKGKRTGKLTSTDPNSLMRVTGAFMAQARS
jgi:hypothetical protein